MLREVLTTPDRVVFRSPRSLVAHLWLLAVGTVLVVGPIGVVVDAFPGPFTVGIAGSILSAVVFATIGSCMLLGAVLDIWRRTELEVDLRAACVRVIHQTLWRRKETVHAFSSELVLQSTCEQGFDSYSLLLRSGGSVACGLGFGGRRDVEALAQRLAALTGACDATRSFTMSKAAR